VIQKRQRPDEGITCYFAVDNLQTATQAVVQNGGQVTVQPFQLQVAPVVRDKFKQGVAKRHGGHVSTVGDSLGTACEVVDSGGSRFGLIEVADFAQPMFNVGRSRPPMSQSRRDEHDDAKQLGKQV